MSKFLFNVITYFSDRKIGNLKKKLFILNKEKKVFSNISYISEEKNYKNIRKIKKIFNEIGTFLDQFDENKKDLGIKLVINMSNESEIFSYKPKTKELKISIMNNYINVKEILNHEFLHALDYYYGKNGEAFSEIHVNIDNKIYIDTDKKIENDITKLQKYILVGEKIKNNNNSILNFDFNILKNSLKTLITDYNKIDIRKEEIEMLTISNIRVFNKFLDAMNILKGQYYLFNDKNSGRPLTFDLNDYLINKNRLFKEFNSLYDDIEHFEKRLLKICNKYDIPNDLFLKRINSEAVKNFNIFINNGL